MAQGVTGTSPSTGNLKPWQLHLYRSLIPVCIALVLWGLFGIYLYTDPEGKSWISRTKVADVARWLFRLNPAFLAMPFNGGMFGFVYIVTALRKHAAPDSAQPPPKLSRQELRHPQKSGKTKKAN
ncbi:g3423 [Coccomyxa viridis]|uniref:G3423 protein n=1 Tax=Coccomyxa viridis TaxID=1274662 RepID=A0ABP1FSW9_9CHLO